MTEFQIFHMFCKISYKPLIVDHKKKVCPQTKQNFTLDLNCHQDKILTSSKQISFNVTRHLSRWGNTCFVEWKTTKSWKLKGGLNTFFKTTRFCYNGHSNFKTQKSWNYVNINATILSRNDSRFPLEKSRYAQRLTLTFVAISNQQAFGNNKIFERWVKFDTWALSPIDQKSNFNASNLNKSRAVKLCVSTKLKIWNCSVSKTF